MQDGSLLDAVAASDGGRRLLAIVGDPRAEKGRRAGRPPRIDGALGDAALLTGDALVDVRAGRTPRAWTLAAAEPRPVAAELRRRLRGTVSSRFLQGAALVAHEDGFQLRVTAASDPRSSSLADPVVTMRAAALVLDGPDAGTLRADDPAAIEDLSAGRLRLTDSAALVRRPEGLVTLARLAARPELRLGDEARRRARAAFAVGAFAGVRQSRLWFALADLLAAPEAIEALELLQGLSSPAPLHESADVDGALLRRADALRPSGASRPLTLILAVARHAPRRRVRSFLAWWGEPRFDGPEAAAVIAAAGPGHRPRWSQP